ncbi:winged helix-turn-helix transcriptional regulator [Brevundimonas sp. FT23042]|uniref:winged helix-turn-helix transcriptional regulator n=1 Tax=Brevundimonas sp. FT23042 TaxID=3393749 RepID=UPI003B58854A
MKWESLSQEPCSIARTSAVIGDRWTVLILREAFTGARRFDDFQNALGISRTIVTDRLTLLAREGVLQRIAYQDRPVRYEYRLTDKGRELHAVLLAMFRWGDRHYGGEAGAPLTLRHTACGHDFHAVSTCSECAGLITPETVEVRPGPGYSKARRKTA